MKTKAVRLYGADDLRLEEFELPYMQQDEILAEVITDSLCMSSYKAAHQGTEHKKVPNDICKNPIIVGHEFCGRIIDVGEKWRHKFKTGDKFCIQPNIGAEGGLAPGYSYPYIGGDSTKIIIQNTIMENDCLLVYHGDSYFEGSLVEPLSCVIGAFNANYHLEKMYSHNHIMGIKEGGNTAILGATGPMGFLAIDLAIHGPKKPKKLVVTGRTQSKLDMARNLYSAEEAKKHGVELIYVNTNKIERITEPMRALTENDYGFDDVFIFAPVKSMVTQGEELLAYDGCLNFFSGPSDRKFTSEINFYNVHYNAIHIVGTSGGNTDDMRQALNLIENKTVNVAKIATHILGLNAVAKTTLDLPSLTGGKKIVYVQKSYDLTGIDSINNMSNNEFGTELAKLIDKNNGLWSVEAENFFINNAPEV